MKYKIGDICSIRNFVDNDGYYNDRLPSKIIPELNGIKVKIIDIIADSGYAYHCEVVSVINEYQERAFTKSLTRIHQYFRETELLPCRIDKLKRILEK